MHCPHVNCNLLSAHRLLLTVPTNNYTFTFESITMLLPDHDVSQSREVTSMPQPWNEDIERILNIAPEGTGSNQLKTSLLHFLEAWNSQPQSSNDLDDAVVTIANSLNWNISDARAAFTAFEQKATDESHNELKHSYIGSKQHLLFGHIVGQVLELPAPFAALLSPTGGMVGPGGFSFHVKGGVLGFHGIAHDAGGYLCRKHQTDPGYEYIIDRTGQPCEDRPLMGQVSGISFWFKTLNLSWLDFLAVTDPKSLLPTLEADLDSLLQPGPLAMDEPPPSPAGQDGVLLNQSELLLLRSLILREAHPADSDLIAAGLSSLQERGLVTGSAEEGYIFSDQLIMATSVYLEPQLMLEASLMPIDDGVRTLRYYRWGDYVVEQSVPQEGTVRLAGLRDAAHATYRLQQIIPIPSTRLDSISLSLTESEYETAVSTSETAEPDPGTALGLDDPQAAKGSAAADLFLALGSSKTIGSIRVHQYVDRQITTTRDLQLLAGSQASWLVSRDSQQAGQVNITLASPTSLTQQLNLS